MTDRRRSLADDLRARDDAALVVLLHARPDLVAPLPSDIGQLASRATTRPSVTRAVDRLDRFALQVLEALAVLAEPASYDALRDLLGAEDDDLRPILDRLHALALTWESGEQLHLVRTVRDIIGPHPAGVGPPAGEALLALPPARVAKIAADLGLPASGDPFTDALAIGERFEDSAGLRALLDELGPLAIEALSVLADGRPTGHLGDAAREVDAAHARTPVEQLLARGLLIPVDDSTVLLPREVGLHLRGGHLHRKLEPHPPELQVSQREPQLVDRTAGSSAAELVRHLEVLLDAWSGAPPPVLRAGGLGARDLRRAAAVLGVDEWYAAWLADLSYAAGLVGASSEFDEVWLPTPAYDAWRRHDPPQRWALLAATWLQSSRTPGLIGTRDERDRLIPPMGHDLDRPVSREIRRLVLEVLAGLPDGAAASLDSLQATVHWHRPRRGGRLRDSVVAWTVREAEALGVTGLSALATPGRALLAGDPAAGVAAVLPAPVDHVLVQADLTAVAPGPLEPAQAAEMGLIADVESRGGATVYRFTAESLRRGMDAGRTAAELLDFLTRISRTPVPQPLTYLVEDVARRHGVLRVGAARTFVRCADEAVLAEILSDRRAGDLGLRRLAPTVLISPVTRSTVLDRLREMGHAPAAEAADGTLDIQRVEHRRAPGREPPRPLLGERPAPEPALLSAAVRAMRAGDRSGERHPEATPAARLARGAAAATVTALRDAVGAGSTVWIEYVDNHGTTSERLVDPVRVEGGWLTAVDHRTGEIRSFALHRVSGVAVLEDEAR